MWRCAQLLSAGFNFQVLQYVFFWAGLMYPGDVARLTNEFHALLQEGSARRDARRKAKAYLVRTANNKIKWTTREIAALDFLLHIPMCAEPTIIQAGRCREKVTTLA